MPKTSPENVAKSPRRTRPRDRRDQILRAAGEIFSARGFHAASLAEIAREVDITSAALYRHFPSKLHLLGQTLLTGAETALTRLRSVDLDDRLTELIEVALEFRGLPRLWQLELRNLAADDRAAMLAVVRELIATIDESIRRRRPDLVPDDSTMLAWVVVSIATSPSHHNVQVSKERSRRLLNALVDAVLAMTLPVAGRSTPVSAGSADAAEDFQPERLIVAAARLFNSRGYGAVGIEDIGAAVGVTGPAIYHHFESKAEILNEIIRRNEQWIGHYISRACTEGHSPAESLSLLMSDFVSFVYRSPDIAGTTFSEARHLPTEPAKRYRTVHRNGVLRWARLIQAVHPDLAEDEARVQVQAMTAVVIDASRNPRLTERTDFVEVFTAVGNAMTFAEADLHD